MNATRSSAIIYLLLQTSFENVGDALIIRQLIEILAEEAEVVINISRAPASFVANLALDRRRNITLHRGGAFGLAREMIRAQKKGRNVIFMLMPGGNSGEKTWLKYTLNRGYNQFLRLLTRFGIRVFQVGVSYEALGPRYTRMVRERAALISRLIVRDQLSANYLLGVGIASHGVLPDLAFNLTLDLARLSTPAPPETIAFSFRVGTRQLSPEQVRSVVWASIAAFPSAKLKFVSQVASDSAFMHELTEECRNNFGKDAVHEDFSQDLDRYSSIYGDCCLLLSNRLHALLLGLTVGVQPVAVLRPKGDAKIRGIFESIGLSDRAVDFPVSPDIIKSFENFVVSQETITRLRSIRQELREGIIALCAAPG